MDNIQSILVNAPIKVNFAGLRGNTMQMQNEGWELNIESYRSHNFHGYEVRLAGRHQGLGLMMYSGIAPINMGEMYGTSALHCWFDSMEFPISAQNIAQTIMMPGTLRIEGVTRMGVDFSRPFMMNTTIDKLMSLEDIFFFRPMNEASTIYLPDSGIISVQDHLNDILSKQSAKQKEIREKKRRMKSREGSSLDPFSTNTGQEEVKLQLVAI